MKKLIFFILILSLNLAFAQDTVSVHDPQAKKILDKVSQRYKNYNTLRLYFEYEVYDNRDTSKRLKKDYKGWLYTKGQNKYKLIIPKLVIFSDGIKNYTYDKKNKELNITWYDPQSQDLLTPQRLLYIYQKGFKYSYRGLATFDTKKLINGKVQPYQRSMFIVDLYPEHPKKSPYSIIRLWIDKDTYQIASIKYQGKNGIDIVVDFLEEKPNLNIPDTTFVYNPKNYPKSVIVNDFTEN